MKKTVYFEIFGKKMKTTVDAVNNSDAEEQVRNKIIFHKIENEKPKTANKTPNYNDMFGNDETFNNIINIFNGKKK